jgi:asparagine synthase (glutamine-hydrolysing)
VARGPFEEAVAVDANGWASARAQFTGRYSTDDVSGTFCVASARVDNRGELLRALGLDVREWGGFMPKSARYDDTHLIHAAYLRWRESSVERICGDWAFAVWRPLERQLFLTRDHFGMTSTYYAIDDDSFANTGSSMTLWS